MDPTVETEPETKPETEPLSEPLTELLTQPETEPETKPLTQLETKPLTELLTQPETEPETELLTELLTEPETQLETEPLTQLETEPLTDPDKSDSPTDPALKDPSPGHEADVIEPTEPGIIHSLGPDASPTPFEDTLTCDSPDLATSLEGDSSRSRTEAGTSLPFGLSELSTVRDKPFNSSLSLTIEYSPSSSRDFQKSKNSDPLPTVSDRRSSLTTKDPGEISSPLDNVFYAELRKGKQTSAPPSPPSAWPSKRKAERKSTIPEPPSIPEISPGRSSIFYTPLDDKPFSDLLRAEASPQRVGKSPPSKRHHSTFSPRTSFPTHFELSGNESDSSPNNSIVDRIECEYKIKEGTIKLFNAAKNVQQSMEAAKSYFTSNAKIIHLLRQLQSHNVQEHVQASDTQSNADVSEASKANISISHTRIPLEWKEFDGLKKPIGTGWVFCLFKLEGEVADTQTLIQVDRNINDISFPDVIPFPTPVSHEFRLEIEVYFSQGLFSNKEHVGKGIKALKSKMSVDSITSSLSSYDSPTNMPRYHLAGYSSLTLSDLSEGLFTYKLNKGAVGSSPTASTHIHSSQLLPLWGQICCQVYVVPKGVKGARIEGFIDLHTMVNGSPVWTHCWSALKQATLFCWNAPEDVSKTNPIFSLTLTHDMEVKHPRAEDGTMRKNTLLIADSYSEQRSIALGNKEERDRWFKHISQCIRDLQVWRNYAVKCQVVPDLLTSKNSFNSRTKRVASPIESLRQSITTPPESFREGHNKKFQSAQHTAAKSTSKV